MTHCKREIPNILFLKEMNIQLLSLMTNLSTETDSSVDTQLGGKKDRYRVILRTSCNICNNHFGIQLQVQFCLMI